MAEQRAQESVEGRPGRYQRSFGGGVAAMLVLVVVVLAFVGLRTVFRNHDEVPVEPVDYLEAVGAAQGAGFDVLYPATLPKGWAATSIDYRGGTRLSWGIGMLTDDERFVAVRQEDADLGSLLSTYVDKDAVQGDPVRVPGAVAEEWQEWSDAGGDHAYAATVGEETVLVYGSAPPADLLTILKSLTTAPLAG